MVVHRRQLMPNLIKKLKIYSKMAISSSFTIRPFNFLEVHLHYTSPVLFILLISIASSTLTALFSWGFVGSLPNFICSLFIMALCIFIILTFCVFLITFFASKLFFTDFNLECFNVMAASLSPLIAFVPIKHLDIHRELFSEVAIFAITALMSFYISSSIVIARPYKDSRDAVIQRIYFFSLYLVLILLYCQLIHLNAYYGVSSKITGF